MGTKIQQYSLGEADFRGDRFNDIPGQLKGNNDVLSLTRPDVIADIHRAYLAVGADIITTNTFSSQRISQADYHLEEAAYDMALAGARMSSLPTISRALWWDLSAPRTRPARCRLM